MEAKKLPPARPDACGCEKSRDRIREFATVLDALRWFLACHKKWEILFHANKSFTPLMATPSQNGCLWVHRNFSQAEVSQSSSPRDLLEGTEAFLKGFESNSSLIKEIALLKASPLLRADLSEIPECANARSSRGLEQSHRSGLEISFQSASQTFLGSGGVLSRKGGRCLFASYFYSLSHWAKQWHRR